MANTTMRPSAFIAGPICLTAYGLIRLTDEEHGPGLAWSLGHLALLAGILLFVPVFRELRRLAARGRGRGGRYLAGTGAAAGLIGAMAVTVQAGIDLVVGFLCSDRAAMRVLFDRVQSKPGMEPAFYTVGPLLLYVGLLLLLVQLAALRRIGAWRPVVIVVAVAAMGLSLDLLPLGGLLFLLALSTLEREVEGGGSDGSAATARRSPGGSANRPPRA